MYNTMIQYFCTLWNGHQKKSNCHLLPCRPITILLTIHPIPCINFLWHLPYIWRRVCLNALNLLCPFYQPFPLWQSLVVSMSLSLFCCFLDSIYVKLYDICLSVSDFIYILASVQFSSFSRSVVSDSLRPHESQHARPPCPSPTPGVHWNSCPLSRWCHPAISSSLVPFSSCPQSLPASESFLMSQLFARGSQSIGVSASASVLPMNNQDWSPLG